MSRNYSQRRRRKLRTRAAKQTPAFLQTVNARPRLTYLLHLGAPDRCACGCGKPVATPQGDPTRCHYCHVRVVRNGRPVSRNRDHIVPRALGGSHHSTNLVWSCQACNSSKSASWPTHDCAVCRRAILLHESWLKLMAAAPPLVVPDVPPLPIPLI